MDEEMMREMQVGFLRARFLSSARPDNANGRKELTHKQKEN